MTIFLPRSAWTSVLRPVSKLTRIDPDVVRGVAVHYTGSSAALGPSATVALSARRLEDERRFHTGAPPSGRGWSDIAYGTAIDQAGNVFDARGHAFRSAANGSSVTNAGYGAVTILIGVGDTPSDAAIQAFREWRHGVWLRDFPKATAVVGHRDLYATECPGGPLYSLVRLGTLAARPTPTASEEDMPLDDADVLRIVEHPRFTAAVREAVWAAKWPLTSDPKGPTEQADVRLVKASRPPVPPSPEQVAAAVLAALPAGTPVGGLSLADVKRAIREVLSEGTGGTP